MRITVLFVSLVVVALNLVAPAAAATKQDAAPEPFPELFGYCKDCLPPQPNSPDPLVRYTWRTEINETVLQIYRVHRPISYVVDPPNAISGADSLSPNTTGPLNLEIVAAGSLLLDWGVERAAWIEITSPDLHLQENHTSVRASISEFNSPYPGKTQALTRYGNTYRLETNPELYEGVRFTWLLFGPPTDKWHITKISLVAKVKPVSYAGSFESSDAGLTKTWYTGAYGVRLNTEADAFNSILIERGDRVSIQGDGHPTMAAALVAFAPYRLVKNMLDQTNSGSVHGHHVVDDSIMAYPLYWTMSVNDWFLASGDVMGFQSLAPDVMSVVDKRVADFLQPDLDIGWMGWDDRLGNGWCFHYNHDHCTREGHLTFAGLVIRACSDLSRSLRLAGMDTEAKKYRIFVDQLARRFRQVAEFPKTLGLHAAANAINAGVVTRNDTQVLFEAALSDSVNICSLSPFNQYWILQALGNADKMEYALASIKLCWEPMTKLGKGCFWELFSPEWERMMSGGDKAPSMPSYCHPWSSGVTAWLSHVLGGITPLLPGYSEFVAAPYVSERYPSVSTVMPTPAGPITVRAHAGIDDERGSISSVTIFVHASVPGYVALRKDIVLLNTRISACTRAPKVFLDGKRALAASLWQVVASARDAGSMALGEHFIPTRASQLLFVRIPNAGFHNVTASYHCKSRQSSSDGKNTTESGATAVGIPHVPPFPIPKYPAIATSDQKSHGDGLATYGTDGYVLFGFDNGTDRINLPSYIKNVTARTHGFTGWNSLERTFVGTSKCDPRFLSDPKSNRFERVPTSGVELRRCQGTNRSLGMISLSEDEGFDAGFLVLDVEISESMEFGDRLTSELSPLDTKKQNNTEINSEFDLSIYCVAQHKGEKHAIRVMDLESLNVIAPTGFVTNYTGGVWWTFRYHSSMRFRIMTIDGIRISAVTFSNGPVAQRVSRT